MSLYSTTKIEELTSRSLNPRTRNLCIAHKLLTVRDIWNYYQSHYTFNTISGVGKKGNKQLIRICTKVAEIMRVQPAASSAIAIPAATAAVPAPVLVPVRYFSIIPFFNSLDTDAKKVAESFYNRFVQRLRWNGQQTLDALCKGLTLEAFINSLSAKPSHFQPYYETAKGRSSEVGKLLQAINSFYASETFAQCAQRPALTLLRLQMNALLATTDSRMDSFLTANFDKLASNEFPLGAFIDAAMNANTVCTRAPGKCCGMLVFRVQQADMFTPCKRLLI